MPKSVYMARSLDGPTTGQDDGLDKSRENGGYRLHEQSPLLVGLLDAVEIHVIPVGFGDGRWLFDMGRIERELKRVLNALGITHLHRPAAT